MTINVEIVGFFYFFKLFSRKESYIMANHYRFIEMTAGINTYCWREVE
jgi:hypothetical protein